MKLIVGLGNPGSEYLYTRHNIGFLAIDKLIDEFKASGPKNMFNAILFETTISNEKIIFCKPQTYMNLSGMAVQQIKQFYKINIEDIVIIYDDKDIDFNVIRLKERGLSAGHNGIKDLISKLGSENFKRVKLGIGRDTKIEIKNWVLGKFNSEQLIIIKNDLLERVYQIFKQFLIGKVNFEKLMSLYNGK